MGRSRQSAHWRSGPRVRSHQQPCLPWEELTTGRNETRRPCPTESLFLLLFMFNIPFLSARSSYSCRILRSIFSSAARLRGKAWAKRKIRGAAPVS